MTTSFPTAKAYLNLTGALCATATGIYALGHPDLDDSFARAIPTAIGSLVFMALGIGKGGQIVRSLTEQYSSKGAKVWEGVEEKLGASAPVIGRSTIFLTMTVGALAAIPIGNMMDNGVPMGACMVASLAAGTLVTAMQAIKEGLWSRMNTTPSDLNNTGSDSPVPATVKARGPRRFKS